jgi:hypothetical protein
MIAFCPPSVCKLLLKTTSPHKQLSQYHPNFTGMFLWWSPLKSCSKNLFPCRILVAMATKRKDLKYLLYKKKKNKRGRA